MFLNAAKVIVKCISKIEFIYLHTTHNNKCTTGSECQSAPVILPEKNFCSNIHLQIQIFCCFQKNVRFNYYIITDINVITAHKVIMSFQPVIFVSSFSEFK